MFVISHPPKDQARPIRIYFLQIYSYHSVRLLIHIALHYIKYIYRRRKPCAPYVVMYFLTDCESRHDHDHHQKINHQLSSLSASSLRRMYSENSSIVTALLSFVSMDWKTSSKALRCASPMFAGRCDRTPSAVWPGYAAESRGDRLVCWDISQEKIKL